jgi:hypothetical protein
MPAAPHGLHPCGAPAPAVSRLDAHSPETMALPRHGGCSRRPALRAEAGSSVPDGSQPDGGQAPIAEAGPTPPTSAFALTRLAKPSEHNCRHPQRRSAPARPTPSVPGDLRHRVAARLRDGRRSSAAAGLLCDRRTDQSPLVSVAVMAHDETAWRSPPGCLLIRMVTVSEIGDRFG